MPHTINKRKFTPGHIIVQQWETKHKRVAIRCNDKGSEIISPKISAERQNTLSRILYSDKFSGVQTQ